MTAAPVGAVADAQRHSSLLRPRSGLSRRASRLAGIGVLVIGLGVLVIRPVAVIQQRALEDGAQGYRDAFTSMFIAETIRTTIFLALGSLAIALVLGTVLAWHCYRLPPRLRWMSALPVLPIIIPTVASVTGWVFLFAPRIGYGNALLRKLPWWADLSRGPIDVYTTPWIVILTGVGLTSFVYLFISAGLGGVNAELMESAEVCGSSKLGVFVRVTLPLLRPSLVYAAATTFLLALGQFTGVLMLGRTENVRVLTTQMVTHISEAPVNFNAAAAIGAPLTLVGLLFVVGQRLLLANRNRFVTHGGKAFRPVGRTSLPGIAVVVVYGLFAAVLPLVAITIVALSPRWTPSVTPSEFTLEHFRAAFDSPDITGAVSNSVSFSIIAALIVIPIGFICSWILVQGRSSSWVRTVVDSLVALPLGVPAVVFGLGFLFAYSGPPLNLYGTKWVIIVVYVTLMLPFTTRLQTSGMMSLGSHHIEASRISGAGFARTIGQIVLPLMRSAIGAAAALTFIILSHEFGASLLVRSHSTQVMGTLLYDSYTLGTYSEVAVIALIMTGVTIGGLTVAFVLAGRNVLRNL